MSSSEQHILSTFMRVLGADGWSFESDEEHSVLKALVSANNGEYRILIFGYDDDNMVGVIVRLPYQVEEEKRLAVCEYLNRANWGLRVGNFEMDMSDGEVRFRIGMDIEGGEMSDDMVRNIVAIAIQSTDRYMPGLSSVITAGRSAGDAVELVESDVFDLGPTDDIDETLN